MTAGSAGGATTGRADIRPFTFSKLVDSSTPKLFQACAAGTHFNKITIAMHRSGGMEINNQSAVSSAAFRRNRARLIQKIYEIDPLLCPKCQGAMKVISFIDC
jgi:hypothetical protein